MTACGSRVTVFRREKDCSHIAIELILFRLGSPRKTRAKVSTNEIIECERGRRRSRSRHTISFCNSLLCDGQLLVPYPLGDRFPHVAELYLRSGVIGNERIKIIGRKFFRQIRDVCISPLSRFRRKCLRESIHLCKFYFECFLFFLEKINLLKTFSCLVAIRFWISLVTDGLIFCCIQILTPHVLCSRYESASGDNGIQFVMSGNRQNSRD